MKNIAMFMLFVCLIFKLCSMRSHKYISPGLLEYFHECVPNGNGHYAMLNEASAGNSDELTLLHELGVSYNCAGCAGTTPLMEAVKNGHSHIVDVILSTPGVFVDARNIFKETALFYSLQGGFEAIAKKLLEYGAQTWLLDKDHRTLVHKAAISKNPRCFDLVLQYGGSRYINLGDIKGDTPLLLALRSTQSNSCKDIVISLLNARIDITKQGFFARNALMFAIIKEHNLIIPDLMMCYNAHVLLAQQDLSYFTVYQLLRNKLEEKKDPLAKETNNILLFKNYVDRCTHQLLAHEVAKKKKLGQKMMSAFSFIRNRKNGLRCRVNF